MGENIKVSFSASGGVVRNIFLAEEFEKRGLLSRLYVPIYRNKKMAALKPKIFENIPVVVLRKLLTVLKIRSLAPFFFHLILCKLIDREVAKKITTDPANILFSESVISLKTLKKAKQKSIIAVLDRTNTHVEYQFETIKREYAKWDIPGQFGNQGIVARGIQEYTEADYICCLSSFVKKSFLLKGIPEKKLLLVPSGIDIRKYKITKQKNQAFTIIFCGQLSVKKGVHYLLQAFYELDLKDTELWLIGSIYPDIKKFLAQYSNPRIKLTGNIPSSQIPEYFSQGHLYVMPSLEEGLAKVVMEAMACGLPVIATPNTGAEDVIREGIDGFIVPVCDVEALKQKILYFYENREKIDLMGKNARERILSDFTIEKYAERLIQTLKNLA